MADRTWNAVDIDAYDGPYSRCARRMLVHLLILQPNQYGIFDLPIGRLMDHWDDVYTAEQIWAALDELQQAGVIQLFREKRCVWIVKKFKREAHNCRAPRQIQGLENFLTRYNEVRDMFRTRYKHVLNGTLPTDPDSDSDTEKKKTKKRKAAAGAAASSKLDQTEKPYSEADLELANWIIKVVETVAEHGQFKIENPRTPQTIASGVAKSGLSHQQIRDTFQWARQNSFQRGG